MYSYSAEIIIGKKELSKLDSFGGIFLKEVSSIDFFDYNVKYIFYNNQSREASLCTKEMGFSSKALLDTFIFMVKDVIIFECFTKTNTIYYQFHKQGNRELLEYWLLHTLLPIFFTMTNKYYFLHAGAVRIDDATVLFMADSMGGKSTMTNHFIQKGHALVSDDKIGTFEESGDFMAVSSYPYHRPYRKYEDLGIKVDNFEKGITKLNIIYMLDVDKKYKEVELFELKGIEKFGRLIRGTEIGLPFFLKERFEYITKFANKIPVYRIHIPKDLDRLDEVYDAIIKHNKIYEDESI